MHSIIQILKVNELKKGVSKKTGNDYEIQDAECLLLNDDGSVDQVGVLQIPKMLREKAVVGRHRGAFAMRANLASRRIEAVLVDLIPLEPVQPKPAAK
jgi:hypothetical protein